MTGTVTIVDYGIGNLFSVARALEKCGAQVVIADQPDEILRASRLVLPGVGAFAQGMQGLQDRSLVDPLTAFAATGRPLLGICLGMQLLFSASEEFGRHAGLGIIEGEVVGMQPRNDQGEPMKVPHIGWGLLQPVQGGAAWQDSVLSGIPGTAHAYFVHSYTAAPRHEAERLADVHYGGVRISAAVRKGNVFGCQFHPEKSASVGLRIMRNFIEL